MAQVQEVNKWRAPIGAWELRINGLVSSGSATLYPDDKSYKVTCLTLCGKDEITIDGTPQSSMSALEFVRRVQLAGSIQHVCAQGCGACRDGYAGVTLAEREWLYAASPQLGQVLGVALPHGLITSAGRA